MGELGNNKASQLRRYPLDERDRLAIEAVADLIQAHAPLMRPRELRSAAVVLLALERMPYATPGVHVTFGFSTPRVEGNWRWADISIHGNDFRMGIGEHFSDPDIGKDIRSLTIFETQAGTQRREGSIDEWIEYGVEIADGGQPMIEDHSDYNDIDWLADIEHEDWDEACS